MKQLCGALCALAIGVSTSASADILSIVQEAPQTVGPQSTSAPCIIAGTNCQNPAGFGYTNFVQGGNPSAFDLLSPIYTKAQFPFLTFNVAVDVNTATNGETLDLFEVFINGIQKYVYSGGKVIGQIPSNGNGYADWTLRTVDLSGIGANDQVQFHAKWSNVSDGAESFFIIGAAPSPVPEPSSWLMMIGGLAMLGRIAVQRRNKQV